MHRSNTCQVLLGKVIRWRENRFYHVKLHHFSWGGLTLSTMILTMATILPVWVLSRWTQPGWFRVITQLCKLGIASKFHRLFSWRFAIHWYQNTGKITYVKITYVINMFNPHCKVPHDGASWVASWTVWAHLYPYQNSSTFFLVISWTCWPCHAAQFIFPLININLLSSWQDHSRTGHFVMFPSSRINSDNRKRHFCWLSVSWWILT